MLQAPQVLGADVWRLACSMDDYLCRRGLGEPHRRAWRLGLTAAERLGDPRIIALVHLCLGRVSKETSHLGQALRLIPDDEPASRAQVHRVMALVFEPRGRNCRQDHRPGEAATEDGLGIVERHAGAIDTAQRHYERPIEIYLEIGNESSAADTLGRLGEMLADAGSAEAEHALRLLRTQHRMAEADRIRKLMRRSRLRSGA